MAEIPTRWQFDIELEGLEDAAAPHSDLMPVYRKHVLAAYDAALARIAELEASSAGEVSEFNAGFHAYETGVPVDEEPSDTAYDVWRAGWAWAAFEPLRARIAELEAALKDIIAARDEGTLVSWRHYDWDSADAVMGEPRRMFASASKEA